ncbi:YybH family protein [Lunatimonas salinarum]|uniref:YybH family protein n=1 Tax=Lunatimonas salinarum TaxID=1774590 RepID=UPI001ADFFDC0|nr:nuclear transport factor 2 family protein [Lunatimonas salinarum]
MHKQISSILFAGILLCACSTENTSTKPTPMDYQKDIEIITAMSGARARAFNDGNASEIARYFAEDAFLMAPSKETLRGKKSVESYYQAIFDEYKTILESGYDDVVVDGDLAYGRGFANVTLISKITGDTLNSTSKYLNILEKRNGEWITTHDIWNGNEP